jgi:uncharacterized protein YfaT (DUF1175 family)
MGQMSNYLILKEARACMGTKVGDGICLTFVEHCLSVVNKDWKKINSKNEKTVINISEGTVYATNEYGRRVTQKEARPGDILFELDHGNQSHISILVSIGNDEITVLDQNSEYRVGDRSEVGTRYIFLDEKHSHFFFFHPF